MNLQCPNSLGFRVQAERVLAVRDLGSLPELSTALQHSDRLLLGAGSNVVIHAPLTATVLLNQLKGRSINAQGVVTCAAGENWHDLVMWTLAQGYAGLENLALIPGTVGAAPIQNIGAYGVEISQVLNGLTAWDFKELRFQTFSKHDCQFGYRHSIFKTPQIQGPWNRPRYLITEVELSLKPIAQAELHDTYQGLKEVLRNRPQADSDKPPTPYEIAQAVIAIRSSKLPDPAVLGNVGSFFKNPVVSRLQAQHLQVAHPDLPLYPSEHMPRDSCKLSAAWLIDRCGFKGVRRGAVGVHDQHALVLVNTGEGTGAELLSLAREIQQAVVGKFGVFLEPEPAIWPPLSAERA